MTQQWMYTYNYQRPHEALQGQTPMLLKYGKLHPSHTPKQSLPHFNSSSNNYL
ncbi:MAG: integrase core domain-containing protein [Bacteroidales bacterium]